MGSVSDEPLLPIEVKPCQGWRQAVLRPWWNFGSFPNMMARRSLVENSLPKPNSSSRMGFSGSVPLFPNLRALQDDGIHGMDATSIAFFCAAHWDGNKGFSEVEEQKCPRSQCGITPQGRGLYPNPRHPGVGGMLSDGIITGIHEPCRSRTQCCCPNSIRLIPQTVGFPLWRL